MQRGLKDLGIVADDKSDPENIWKRFEGKANTKEVLNEKAKSLSQLICVSVFKDAELLFNQLADKDMEIEHTFEVAQTFRKLFLEFSLFYVHFTDRQAFAYLEANEREFFIDSLFVEMRTLLTSALSHSFEDLDQEMKFFADFGNAYNERQVEYGKYKKMVAEKDEGLGNTLLWEFEKKIAQILESEVGIAEFQMVIIMCVHSVITYSLGAMQIGRLFRT